MRLFRRNKFRPHKAKVYDGGYSISLWKAKCTCGERYIKSFEYVGTTFDWSSDKSEVEQWASQHIKTRHPENDLSLEQIEETYEI